MKLGIIGQGFVGKSYADEFESRGYEVVRYSQEQEYLGNKEQISTCDVVFIAVPTPTTPDGFDISVVEDVLQLVGDGKIAVIKSTILPGTTDRLQEKFPSLYILHSPEFLVAKTADKDAKHPERNIVGYTSHSQGKAELVLSLLPPAPYVKVIPAKDAEMIKYMGNIFLTQKVIFANAMYDLSQAIGADYDNIREAVGMDKRITPSHLNISQDNGRGAGGHCFIKDLAAFSQFYQETLPNDETGKEIFTSLEEKNKALLISTNKDIDILKGVYGEMV
jgi:UDPglucose 6-dehydrogenase